MQRGIIAGNLIESESRTLNGYTLEQDTPRPVGASQYTQAGRPAARRLSPSLVESPSSSAAFESPST